MTEHNRSNNLAFFDYCETVGLFDEQTSKRFRTDFRDADQRQLLCELAKYLEFLTASDFYDISNRFYYHWLANLQRQKTPRGSQVSQTVYPSSHQHALEGTRPVSEAHKVEDSIRVKQFEPTQSRRASNTQLLSPESQEEREIELFYSSKNPSKRTTTRREPSAQLQPQETFGSSSKQPVPTSDNRKITKLFDLYSKLEKKMSKNSFDVSKDLHQESPYRSRSPPEKVRSPLVSPNAKRHDLLYEDYFAQNEAKALKWHMARLEELSDCTFAPKTNQNKNSKILSDLLKTPVFDRLSKVKPVKESLQQHSFDSRALKGATFSPDISRSQAKYSITEDNRSPEVKKTQAAERLYEKAKLKERNLIMKRIVSQERESKNYPFCPQVQSPTKDKRRFQQNIGEHVERMYSEADRRKRNLIKKEGAQRDKEMEIYTFTPASMTKKYRSKSGSRSPDPFNRLYSEAVKRHEKSQVFEREMAERDSMRNASSASANKRLGRSQSATSMVVRKKRSFDAGSELRSPYAAVSQFKDTTESSETPAFDRLYNQQKIKEERMKKLEAEIMRERGVTFKPKSMTKSYNPNRTHNPRGGSQMSEQTE